MLKKLIIQNYALIESLEIDFSSGFSVITGETGSGKSIFMGALSLIIGERADHKVLYNKKKKCIIEGFFKPNNSVNLLLDSNDIDNEEELILRRVITSNGKSRAFVNDSPVKLEFLKKIGDLLIDFHDQNQTSLLSQAKYQYTFIDSAVEASHFKEEYTKLYNVYIKNHNDLENLLIQEAEAENQRDYLNFQLKELQKYPFENWEEEDIENEYNKVSNIENIKSIFSHISQQTNGPDSILNKVEELKLMISELSLVLPEFEEFEKRINSVSIEVNDIFMEIFRKSSVDQIDPRRKDELEDQIHIINSLIKKFNVVSLKELIIKKNELTEKLSGIESLNIQRVSLENEVNLNKEKCIDLGKELYRERKGKAKMIEDHIAKILSKLSMPNARIKIDLDINKLHPKQYGVDTLKIYISTNKGGKYYLINEIASGGELSRILLSIKSLLTFDNTIPTIIFDEIDAGVSGKVANEVGLLLKKLSKHAQLLCITHLPQVAAMGDVHYNVVKENDDTRTYTKIIKLNKDDRLLEIANMLGGSSPGRAALENAAELLN